jgi:Lectin C-type domain
MSAARGLALLAIVWASACAESPPILPEVTIAGGSAGTIGLAGSGGAWAGDSGFPGGTAGATNGGAAGSGAGGSAGAVCRPEICNGLDDDCNGTPDDVGTCIAGCTGDHFQGGGYAFCTNQATLSNSADLCINQLKMKPTRPNNAAENDWLRSTATKYGLGVVWLGATDWANEGTFDWPDGESWPNGMPPPGYYSNWGAGEPNNGGSKDCIQMGLTGTWSVVSCDGKAAVICEDY